MAGVDRELTALTDAEVESYAAGRLPDPTLAWERLTTDQRFTARAANEQARRANKARRDAVASAQEQERQQRDAARIAAQIAAYKAQVRGRWVGTDAQFNAAWPEMLRRWQIEQAMVPEPAARGYVGF